MGTRGWVMLVLLAPVLLGLLGLLVLRKNFRSTPAGFRPEVRISLLDRAQAWSLQRKARQAERAGDHRLALASWRAAWGNDLGNLALCRHTLRAVLRADRPEANATVARQAAGWLVTLGRTNQADLELVGEVWLTCGLDEPLLGLLRDLPGPLPLAVERLRLIALFHGGHQPEFLARVGTNAVLAAEVQRATAPLSGGPEPTDLTPQFRLVCAAFLAAYGKPDRRVRALEVVRAAQGGGNLRPFALNLEFLIHLGRRDTVALAEFIHEREAEGRATVRHHISYWMLLLSEGRKEEAANLARAANLVPTTADEALRLARAEISLELWSEAEALLTRYQNAPGFVEGGWEVHADLLIKREKWDELRTLASRLRLRKDLETRLGGYSHFLEGVAEWERGGAELGGLAFQKAAEAGIPDARLALKSSQHLLRLGANAWAEPLLLAHTNTSWANPAFLVELLKCAERLKRDPYLESAASRLLELRPRDPEALEHSTRALCVARRDPAEAVTRALALRQVAPRANATLLLHAAALLLNSRAFEAAQILDQIDRASLAPDEAAQYDLAEFEANWKRGRRAPAEAALGRIDPDRLFPAQKAWLTTATREFRSSQ